MKVVCMDCGALIREREGEGTSHGLCPACYEARVKAMDEHDEQLRAEAKRFKIAANLVQYINAVEWTC